VIENETTRSLEEMLFDTSTAALKAAGLTAEELDGVVLSGNDQIDGRVISIMASAGPTGGVNRDTMRLHTVTSASKLDREKMSSLLGGQNPANPRTRIGLNSCQQSLTSFVKSA
jgi:hypothetical protein